MNEPRGRAISTSWTAVPIAIGIAALFVAPLQALRFGFRMDDAYIVFSYARNWVDGAGLVFNPGERVEGYTCFLWVALSALGIELGFDIESWSRFWCLAASTATVGATWCLASTLLPERRRSAAAFAAIAIAAYPPLAWWSGSRMETVLFTCWVTAALAFHARRGAASIGAPLCLAAAALTRPEGWWIAALLCADALQRGPRRSAWRYAAIVAAVFSPYYVWRCMYYGYPLPNTFYAKVGATGDQVWRGLRYLADFAQHPSTWWLFGLASMAPWTRCTRIVPLMVLVYLLYIVVVGGDVFDHYRFLVPIVPALCAAAIAGAVRIADRVASTALGLTVAAGVAVGLFVLSCVPMHVDQRESLRRVRLMNGLLEAPCAAVLQSTGPNDSIAAVGIGLIKYCTNRRVIDLVGLTDTHIAHRSVPGMGRGRAGHEKYDAAYVLAQRPAFIFIPLSGMATPLQVPATRALWADPDLERNYIGEGQGALTWYRRRDLPPLPISR